MALSRITANSIADGTVVAADIADGSITTAKIASGVLPTTVANATTATTFTANQTFTVANVTNQLISSGAAYQNIVRLTDDATITPNLAQTNNFVVTLGGNRTMANATNITAGQSGVIFVQQDETGSRTLAFGTGWRFPSNTAPTLTTTANAVDMIVYTAWTSSNLAAQAVLNVS